MFPTNKLLHSSPIHEVVVENLLRIEKEIAAALFAAAFQVIRAFQAQFDGGLWLVELQPFVCASEVLAPVQLDPTSPFARFSSEVAAQPIPPQPPVVSSSVAAATQEGDF